MDEDGVEAMGVQREACANKTDDKNGCEMVRCLSNAGTWYIMECAVVLNGAALVASRMLVCHRAQASVAL